MELYFYNVPPFFIFFLFLLKFFIVIISCLYGDVGKYLLISIKYVYLCGPIEGGAGVIFDIRQVLYTT